jgi:origin recognition complex subunit 1
MRNCHLDRLCLLSISTSVNPGQGEKQRECASSAGPESFSSLSISLPAFPSQPFSVVLVDELDQMITKKQDVVYNFFNWPHVAHSRLIVIAVANTMDLPERELSGKIRSRLGSNRCVFTPYKWEELQQIMNARLGEDLRKQVFEPKAIEMIARKVAAGAGDARRALDIAR